MRGKRPPTSHTKRPEKGDELTYYLKRDELTIITCKEYRRALERREAPDKSYYAASSRSLRQKAGTSREFRPSDSAAATNDKTVRKNISQAHQKLKCGSES